MVFDGFGWKFRGPRSSEVQFQDVAYRRDVVDTPCGKCELCLVDVRYSKALRIMLEAESWPDKAYFLTLTFDRSHIGDGVLDHGEWSQFMKNFRQKFCQVQYCLLRDRGGKRHGRVYSKTFKSIKQVMCGEYGDSFGRKHFHGIIFNHSFADIEFTGEYSSKGNPVFTSRALEAVWKKGRVQIAEVNFDLALYVGSYVTDKVYDGQVTGQYGRFGRGIGESWIRKYWRDVLSVGKIILSDGEYPIPRYFLKKVSEWYPVEFFKFRTARDLKLFDSKVKNISKGDGPLRRAQAKARIQQSNRQKRCNDGKI